MLTNVKVISDNVRRRGMEVLLLAPVCLYLTAFLILIFYYLTALSFTWTSPRGAEIVPSLKNYIYLIGNAEFLSALQHTIIFVVIGTPLELLAGLVLALVVHKQFRFTGAVRSFFIIPLAVPAIVTAAILVVMFDYPGGHVNTILQGKHWFFPSVIDVPINWRNSAPFALGVSLVGKVWRDMPISMLIILSGLSSIPSDQYQAAETLGAGTRAKFRYVTLPLLMPAISTVLVIRSIEMWKEFIFPYFLARRFHLLGTLIEYLYHDWDRKGAAAAVSVVLVICIVVFAAVIFWAVKRAKDYLVRI
ncbi:MAG: sugar ABC transporter permease [Fibrobacteres bacterium]|nr:sugar ABC transporter permease [Fibrobacterota bacterium]